MAAYESFNLDESGKSVLSFVTMHILSFQHLLGDYSIKQKKLDDEINSVGPCEPSTIRLTEEPTKSQGLADASFPSQHV